MKDRPAVPNTPNNVTKPSVPPEAADAAEGAFLRGSGYSTRERVRWAVAAALPHLLPGLFVAPDGGGCLTIWAEGESGVTERPTPQLTRTAENGVLFDALAALLPITED